MGGPLEHLRVVEISDTLTGAQVGHLLADLGAEVIAIEPPGGLPMRTQPAFPFVARGKKSIVLDLHHRPDAEVAWKLASEADVVVTTLRPSALARFGLDYSLLSVVNPRLVYGSVTAWGRTGPMSEAKGYEALVLAKLGAMGTSYVPMSDRPGPTFATVPYASWAGTQTLLQGIFAALTERESSGAGQLVEVSMAKALSAIDPWNQANAAITNLFPDAFVAADPIGEDGIPNYTFTYTLLVAITKDGHWLQFSQVQPHLFKAFIHAAGLGWMYDDPKWSTVPDFEDRQQRLEFWNILLTEAHQRTLAEWQQVFANDSNVFAEIFRRDTDLLHHPQMDYAHQTITLKDAERGDVLQPAALIRFDGTPAQLERGAPKLDEHAGELRDRVADINPKPVEAPKDLPARLPLEGVTILELATFYAAPEGATLLTDLGARVIKIEPIQGEPLRYLQAFPGAGAMKVLQGKESVALDLASPEAREIIPKIAAKADLVLCSFRGGVADRLGVGFKDLIKSNPRIVYLDSPGYGTDGPFARKPAFAPTMSAGSGIAMRNVGNMIPKDNVDDLTVIRRRGQQLSSAGGGSATQPDGVAALVVGTTLSLGAYLQRIGVQGQHVLTSMLQSCSHALAEDMVEYTGRPLAPTVDSGGYGFNATYRLYETSDGWVMLTVPSDRDWSDLVAVEAFAELATDPRFVTAEDRAEHDGELAQALAAIFATRPAVDWERDLLAADVGCVVVDTRNVENNYLGDFGQEHDYLATIVGPVLGEYSRVGPIQSFSRSLTTATADCSLGQHTEAVLREFGYDDAAIRDLTDRGVIVCD